MPDDTDKPIDIKFKRDPKDGWPYYLGRNGVSACSGLHLSLEFEFNGQAGRILSPLNGRGDISQSCRIFIPTEALHALALALDPPAPTTYITVAVDGGNVQKVSSSRPKTTKVCLVDWDNIEAGDPDPCPDSISDYTFPVDKQEEPK